ncbi:Helicase and polymerase-containing protein TEBICHI [Raphanus sativus]|nr:Helicase and polymerase-containing protein TEBICHI [Raphanus sativus]
MCSSWYGVQGTGQKRIQLGLAKKIKNGARKIVLEKAEEARAAAFSAFKSLGLDVHGLSNPLPLAPTGNPNGQETIERDISGALFLPVDYSIFQDNLAWRGTWNVETLTRIITEKSQGKIYSWHCWAHAVSILSSDDRDIKNKDNAEQKLTRNAAIFLLAIRIMQVDSRISYEIHGIAVCWDSSPVYYVNLNKDLLSQECAEKLSKDVAIGKKEVLGTHDMFDVIKSRWNRISNIMGNEKTRKFTWNLKVQISS